MTTIAEDKLQELRNLYADTKEERLSTGGHKKYDRLLKQEKEILVEIEHYESKILVEIEHYESNQQMNGDETHE